MISRLFPTLLLVPCIAAFSQNFAAIEKNFPHPPASSRPQTYWLWMNGHVTRDGIARDLAAMKQAGLGGALIFDGGQYLPKGPVDYLSPAWQNLMSFAIGEGRRLGLEIGMHNAPGWSSTGGPWITPEMSMQQLVWSEMHVHGPVRLQTVLPQPATNEGYYRDAFVLAFPSLPGEEEPYQTHLKQLSTGSGKIIHSTSVSVTPSDFLQFEFTAPYEARAITVYPTATGRFPALSLEVSDDGVQYLRVATIANPGRHGILAPGVRNFPAVRGRFYRLVPNGPGDLAEVTLHAAPRIVDWNFKANFTFRVGQPMEPPTGDLDRFAIDPKQVRDLTAQLDPQGRLTWDVPAGDWTILRLGHTSTGQRNVSASESGSGLECDKFSRAAVDFHFDHVIGKVLRADKSLAAVEIDSYEAGMQNWSAQFPEEFRRRNGYDLRSYLPAMTGLLVGSAAISDRFLFDVRRTQADLMAEDYYGRMAELCRQHGLKFYVEGYGQGVFDELAVGGVPEFPMAEFWERTPFTPNRVMKSVSSAAHIYGRPIVAAESFTGEEETARWQEYPYALKALGDYMFSLGLNQIVFHRYTHQPHPSAAPGMSMGPWGFPNERTNTWFAQSSAWIDYLTRCQYLLRQGSYVADVLYFVGENSPNVAQYRIPAVPAGYTYDLVDAATLLARARVEAGRIVLDGGERYRLLVLPTDLHSMTAALSRKLKSLVDQGALVVGPRPQSSPSLRDYPAGDAEVRRNAAWTSAPIADALRAHAIAPDFTYTSRNPDAALSWTHRQFADGDLYFVANRQRRVEDVVCSFRIDAKQPEIWLPDSGTIIRPAVFATDGGRVRLPLHFDPAGSVFVVFRQPARAPALRSVSAGGHPILDARDFAAPKPSAVVNTFTISVWAKPDIDLRAMPRESTTGRIDETGKNYVVPAPEGDALYGPGHVAAGIAAGRNGVFVIERSRETSPAVLVANMPLSGWTHLALVYQEGKPRLFVNGKFVRAGLSSGHTVHPGVGAPPPSPETAYNFAGLDSIVRAGGLPPVPSQGLVYYFEGNMTRPEVFDRALSDQEVQAIAARPLPLPEDPADLQLSLRQDGKVLAEIWRSGNYRLGTGATGAAIEAQVPTPVEINGPWNVAFPPHLGAPPSIVLPALASLHRHPDPGVKYFSGTATYRHDLNVPASYLARDRRVYLDLGRVEVIAQVRINRRDLAVLWKEPFRLDITSALHAGSNNLEVLVTNLWPNRMIGDEQLPPENSYGMNGQGILRVPDWYLEGAPKPGDRITFTTWKFFGKDDPLLESGLLGPVRLWNPIERVLGQ